MASIHYYVHGRGRGHATRSLAVVETLRAAGHHVSVFAGQGAAPFFERDPDLLAVDSLMPGDGLQTFGKLARRLRLALSTM